MEKAKTLSALSIIGMFLLLELLTFISFGLSNSYIVYSILGLAVLAVISIAHYIEIKKEGISNILVFLMPLFLYGLLIAIGPFHGKDSLNTQGFTRIMLPIGLLSFATLGYFSSFGKTFKISTALMLIYGGLALITLISYFATMIQYIPFYTIIHSNSYIYYNGAKAEQPIGSMAYFLAGFSFKEVTVSYFSLYPSVLLSSIVALFFISPKKETKKFILFAIYALIALVVTITMPTKYTLIGTFLVLIAVIFVICLGKKVFTAKILKRIFLVILILFVIAFFILFLNAQSTLTSFRNLIASNPVTNKLFNNGLVSKYSVILDGCYNFNSLLGYALDLRYSSATHFDALSNSIFFDSIILSGLFGLIILVIIAIIGVRSFIRYFRSDKDTMLDKVLIAGFILSFIAYGVIAYDMQPYIFYSDFIPFYMNGLFLVVIFLYGYIYKNGAKVEMKKEEKPEEDIAAEREDTFNV